MNKDNTVGHYGQDQTTVTISDWIMVGIVLCSFISLAAWIVCGAWLLIKWLFGI